MACGIFPNQGSNLCPLYCQVDSYTISHQGSPCTFKLSRNACYFWKLYLQPLEAYMCVCVRAHMWPCCTAITGSPPSHRMGFERNKDSFLSSIRVSKGGLRMIIHFLKTTCAARVPLTLPLCSDLAPAVCSSRRAPSLHTWCPSASAPSSLGSALGRLGSGPPSPLRVAVSCSCAGAPGTACLGLWVTLPF